MPGRKTAVFQPEGTLHDGCVALLARYNQQTFEQPPLSQDAAQLGPDQTDANLTSTWRSMSVAEYSLDKVNERESEQPEFRQPTEVVVREILETLLLTFFIFWLVNSLIGRYRIDGSSMSPTLADSQYLIINNVTYFLDEPQRGDVIVFQHPRTDLNLIKRVIGLPGDHIEVENGTVWVNDRPLDEPYVADMPSYSGSWDVPANAFFVLGDNRNNSSDSHSWGYLPRDNILGKAMVIYWPPNNWGVVPHFPLDLG